MTADHLRLSRAAESEVASLARPLVDDPDLDHLVRRIASARFVCLGGASHGTHEFYEWRSRLTRRLVEHGDFGWIGVEADWPDCRRIHRWVTGRDRPDRSAAEVLAGFARWPEWMWANREVADFLDWLSAWNRELPTQRRVGFYGLDVYSLWDSLRRIRVWLAAHAPESVPDADRAWACFLPCREDRRRSGRGTPLVPSAHEAEVVDLLAGVQARALDLHGDTEFDAELDAEFDAEFDAVQSAVVAAGAERYYRAIVGADGSSWNLRDHQMTGTVERIAERHDPDTKGVVWAHNSHVGDARATDMASAGTVNIGQLLRERHGLDAVALVGTAAHRGRVLAARAWGAPEQSLPLPDARPGSHEELLHRVLGRPSVLIFDGSMAGPWLGAWAGHRAVGVVYDPVHEADSYVPTLMGGGYDAQLWFEQTSPVRPLPHERAPSGPEPETEPGEF